MKFRVQIPDLGIRNMGFSKISGITQESDIVEYREGNESLTMRKQPGLIKQPEITLERGLVNDIAFQLLLLWRERTSTILTGAADGSPALLYKQPVNIGIMDRAGAVAYEISLINAWPVRIEYGDLDASTSEVFVARFILAHEGLSYGNLAFTDVLGAAGAVISG
jgi:phage tail-like protein